MQFWHLFLLSAPLTQAHLLRRDDTDGVIKDDTFFYGQSPAVYPTPEMVEDGPWAASRAKAKALISRMTIEEKANITIGQSGTGCTGAIGSVARVGFPGLCFAGAVAGMKQQELVNSYGGGGHTGASWNKDLVLDRAKHMAREFRAKGAHIQGAPMIGALGRTPRGGRNDGGFSNDPYLAGQLASLMAKGIMSQGVMPTAKHFIGDEQESYRMSRVLTKSTESISANIDDKTMHELYLWPWADVIRAGTPAVMCSYNRVNNSHSCQNSKTLNGLLKGELGFQGWVMSDWYAMNSGVASALGGLDAVLPTPLFWGLNGSALIAAVKNGSIPESRLDDMATRIVAAWYQVGQDSGYTLPGDGTTLDFVAPHKKVYARDPKSKPIILQNAIEGHVLVKNVNGALPLKKDMQMLSVFGYDAHAPLIMNVPDAAGPVYMNGWGVGAESTDPSLLNMLGTTQRSPAAAYNGTLIHAGGSEASAPSYMFAPIDAIQERSYDYGTSVFWDFVSEKPNVDPNSEACLVFINAWSTEGTDREALRDDFSDNLVLNVAKKCSNTMVFIHNAGIRLVDEWIDHPNVTAVMFAHLPGQDTGRALAQIIYGDVSPSGKLPYTVAKKEEDYSVGPPAVAEGMYSLFPQANFTEGVYIDYRHFDKANMTPRFEFGYGMTYTTFEYSKLDISPASQLSKQPQRPPAQRTRPGGNPALWDVLATVTVRVENTGKFEAAEIAQLYVGIPGGDTPVRQLRGFDKHVIPKGHKKTFSFELTRKDLSVWDVVKQDWLLRRGNYTIFVGASSRNLPLVDTLVI